MLYCFLYKPSSPFKEKRYTEGTLDYFEFDRQAKSLNEGEVLVARNVYDTGPRVDGTDELKRFSYGSNTYATNDPSVLVPVFDPKNVQGFRKGGAIYNLQKRVGKK